MHWLFAALGVAVLWGAVYAMTGRALSIFSSYSLLTFYALFTALVFAPLGLMTGAFREDMKVFFDSSRDIQITFLLIGALSVVANYLLYYAIQEKNATVASLIEIMYPIFTIFFVYLLYREVELTPLGFFGVAVAFLGLTLVVVGAK